MDTPASDPVSTPAQVFKASVLDGKGRETRLTWEQIREWNPEHGVLWIHGHRGDPQLRRWLETESGLDPSIVDALLADDTRPRSLVIGSALLLNLRGVDLNEGAAPHDTVSVRAWVEPSHIITLRRQRVMALHEIRERLDAGDGPSGCGEFVATLAAGLIERVRPALDSMDEEVDVLEDRIGRRETRGLRAALGLVRRRAIVLRRFLAPQREALARLGLEPVPWLDDRARASLRETTERVALQVEDLDLLKDRAQVAQEEMQSRLADRLDRRMYLLSLIAAVFLPLTAVTGLLGVNVAGIPGAHHAWAFAIVSVSLLVAVVVQVVLFRKMRWI